MSGRTVRYSDDEGVMDDLGPRVLDFLPLPEQLAVRDDTVKVTLALSRRSVEFFEAEVAKRRVP